VARVAVTRRPGRFAGLFRRGCYWTVLGHLSAGLRHGERMKRRRDGDAERDDNGK
jgi:hypothetical protein